MLLISMFRVVGSNVTGCHTNNFNRITLSHVVTKRPVHHPQTPTIIILSNARCSDETESYPRYINRDSIATDALIASATRRDRTWHACDSPSGHWPPTLARNKSLDKRRQRGTIMHTCGKRSVNHGSITVCPRVMCSHA